MAPVFPFPPLWAQIFIVDPSRGETFPLDVTPDQTVRHGRGVLCGGVPCCAKPCCAVLSCAVLRQCHQSCHRGSIGFPARAHGTGHGEMGDMGDIEDMAGMQLAWGMLGEACWGWPLNMLDMGCGYIPEGDSMLMPCAKVGCAADARTGWESPARRHRPQGAWLH